MINPDISFMLNLNSSYSQEYLMPYLNPGTSAEVILDMPSCKIICDKQNHSNQNVRYSGIVLRAELNYDLVINQPGMIVFPAKSFKNMLLRKLCDHKSVTDILTYPGNVQINFTKGKHCKSYTLDKIRKIEWRLNE